MEIRAQLCPRENFCHELLQARMSDDQTGDYPRRWGRPFTNAYALTYWKLLAYAFLQAKENKLRVRGQKKFPGFKEDLIGRNGSSTPKNRAESGCFTDEDNILHKMPCHGHLAVHQDAWISTKTESDRKRLIF